MPHTAPWHGFREAADAAVHVLHDRIGLDLWLVTEVVGEDQVVVAAAPGNVMPPGASAPWAESYCIRMVAGEGPPVASVVAAVPAYAGLRAGQDPRPAAYLGAPLHRADGSLYGTLCAFSTRAQPPGLSRHLPMVELVAGLLATVLADETRERDETR